MKTRSTTFLAAGALAASTLLTLAPAAQAAESWRTGWCAAGEGLSVVVDFGEGESTGTPIPAAGWSIRCLVGGVFDSPRNELVRVALLEAVGHEVKHSSGYVTAIDDVEEYSGNGTDWMFSGAPVGAPWNTRDYGVISGSSNIDVAFGARLVSDWADAVPRPTPQLGEPAAPEPDPEVRGSTPTVAGTARVGSLLSANPGVWEAGARLTYRWFRGATPIAGATSRTYAVTAADRGRQISVTVSGSAPGRIQVTKSSAKTVAVAAGHLSVAKPTVTGKSKVGKKLTARVRVSGTGSSLTFGWLRNGKSIKGATKSTYKIKKADRAKKISVRITVSQPGFHTVVVTSKKTKKVAR